MTIHRMSNVLTHGFRQCGAREIREPILACL